MLFDTQGNWAICGTGLEDTELESSADGLVLLWLSELKRALCNMSMPMWRTGNPSQRPLFIDAHFGDLCL